jgi:hypothetical protein
MLHYLPVLLAPSQAYEVAAEQLPESCELASRSYYEAGSLHSRYCPTPITDISYKVAL